MDITRDMIQEYIHFEKSEFNHDCSEDEALNALTSLKSKGCLLYSDCRSCPKFGKNCSI